MRTSLRLLALSSALLLALSAAAESRPHYGGVLRVELRDPVASVDPRDDSASRIVPLIFDTLVILDDAGRPQPSLAVHWTAESDHRWSFILRPDVKFSNGTPLSAANVADSLRAANPGWNVRDLGNVVIIETDQPSPGLLGALALPANAIALRDGGSIYGTGPFTIAALVPGTRIVLATRDDGWHSRPFVDRIEIRLGRALRQQSADLESGLADVVELAPEEGPRAGSVRRIVRGDPSILYALRFSHTNQPTRDARIRTALSLALDREAIANVLLQRRGEAVASLLPNWMTGFSFLFPTEWRIDAARQLRRDAGTALPMVLVYHVNDPLARLIAERVALNAADAGLVVRPTPDTLTIAVPDIELLELPLPSSDPATAAAMLSRPGVLGLPYTPPTGGAIEDVYRATALALKDTWAVPIVYAPESFGLGPRVLNWSMSRIGNWRLDGVSLPAQGATP
jgi:peptide/nickel transport system substrate-binding protein